MTTDEKSAHDKKAATGHPPVAGRNWSRYLWMIVGGVGASGSTRDHLWSRRARLTALAAIVILFVLLWVLVVVVHH
jgi:hypothetical protein